MIDVGCTTRKNITRWVTTFVSMAFDILHRSDHKTFSMNIEATYIPGQGVAYTLCSSKEVVQPSTIQCLYTKIEIPRTQNTTIFPNPPSSDRQTTNAQRSNLKPPIHHPNPTSSPLLPSHLVPSTTASLLAPTQKHVYTRLPSDPPPPSTRPVEAARAVGEAL